MSAEPITISAAAKREGARYRKPLKKPTHCGNYGLSRLCLFVILEPNNHRNFCKFGTIAAK